MCRNSTFGKKPRKIGKHPIFTENSRIQKMKSRRARSGPDKAQARARPGRAWPVSGRLRHFLGLPSWLYEARDVKLTGGSKFFQKEVRYAATTRNPIPGTRNSILAPCRDGELEEIVAIIITNASTSTNHDSPHPCVSNSPAVG